MKKLRKPLLLSGLFLAGVILSVVLFLTGQKQPEQQAAKRWSADDTRYTQISVFLGGSRTFSENEINGFRVNLSKKLEEASLKPKTDDARLWIDAYSKELTGFASLGKEREEVFVTAVKGDFFQFHPIELVSGYYFRPDELMDDRIIIDETLAWKLFGSSDVAGMDLELNDRRCFVAGVAKNPSGRVETYAYGAKPRIYAPMELVDTQSTEDITCYEVLIPNPVKGFGKKLVTDYLFGEAQAGEEKLLEERQRTEDVEVVENTSRFQLLSLLGLVKDFGIRSMRENQIKYPYWENVARVREDYSTLCLLAAIAAFILPVVVTLQFLHKKWKNRKWRKEYIFAWMEKKKEASWEKRRKKNEEKN